MQASGGHNFYNTSLYDLRRLTQDAPNIEQNFNNYLNGDAGGEAGRERQWGLRAVRAGHAWLLGVAMASPGKLIRVNSL